MFPNFKIFDESNNVLLAQLEMVSAKDVEPAPPKQLSAPMAALYDQVEALVTSAGLRPVRKRLRSSGVVIHLSLTARLISRLRLVPPLPPLRSVPTSQLFQTQGRGTTLHLNLRECSSTGPARTFGKRLSMSTTSATKALGFAGASVKTASLAYWAKVKEVQKEKNLTQSQAMQLVNRSCPDLREAMVREVNS